MVFPLEILPPVIILSGLVYLLITVVLVVLGHFFAHGVLHPTAMISATSCKQTPMVVTMITPAIRKMRKARRTTGSSSAVPGEQPGIGVTFDWRRPHGRLFRTA